MGKLFLHFLTTFPGYVGAISDIVYQQDGKVLADGSGISQALICAGT